MKNGHSVVVTQLSAALCFAPGILLPSAFLLLHELVWRLTLVPAIRRVESVHHQRLRDVFEAAVAKCKFTQVS